MKKKHLDEFFSRKEDLDVGLLELYEELDNRINQATKEELYSLRRILACSLANIILKSEKLWEKERTYGVFPRWARNNKTIWGRNWLDHPSRRGKDLISEPYGLSKSDIKSILQISDDLDLNPYIAASSSWFPSRTVKLTLFKKENEI